MMTTKQSLQTWIDYLHQLKSIDIDNNECSNDRDDGNNSTDDDNRDDDKMKKISSVLREECDMLTAIFADSFRYTIHPLAKSLSSSSPYYCELILTINLQPSHNQHSIINYVLSSSNDNRNSKSYNISQLDFIIIIHSNMLYPSSLPIMLLKLKGDKDNDKSTSTTTAASQSPHKNLYLSHIHDNLLRKASDLIDCQQNDNGLIYELYVHLQSLLEADYVDDNTILSPPVSSSSSLSSSWQSVVVSTKSDLQSSIEKIKKMMLHDDVDDCDDITDEVANADDCIGGDQEDIKHDLDDNSSVSSFSTTTTNTINKTNSSYQSKNTSNNKSKSTTHQNIPNFWSLSFNSSDSSQNTYRKLENPELLRTRKNLPAWNSKQSLIEMMAKNQAIVLTGIMMIVLMLLLLMMIVLMVMIKIMIMLLLMLSIFRCLS
jgi:hypothetical protein